MVTDRSFNSRVFAFQRVGLVFSINVKQNDKTSISVILLSDRHKSAFNSRTMQL